MATEYTNRARRVSDSTLHYWTTLDDPDPTMASPSAPSPADNYADVVVVSRRAVRSGLTRESLSGQVDGSATTFTTSSPFTTGTLRVFWNGQVVAIGDIAETGPSTFGIGLTPDAGDAIEVEYRPA